MANIASLIVKIGAQDQEISEALTKLVGNARRADADLSKLGSTPLAKQAISSIADLSDKIKGITDAQQKFADRAVLAAQGLDTIGGASKLMSRELDQVARTINQGLDAFRALGKEAPADLQAMARAVTEQQKALKSTTEQGSPILGFLTDLKTHIVGTAAGFVSAQAAIGAVQTGFRALTGLVADSVVAYSDAEAAQSKLVAALRQQKTATPEVIDQYNALASEFQRTTVFSDDLVNKMEALLAQVGNVMPSKMGAALKASTDLAAGLGIDLESATTLVAKAAAGHTETLGKYGITVSEAAVKTQGFDAVLEAVNRQFGGQAQAQIETYAGRVEQIKNAWNNVEEAIGKFIVKSPLVELALRSTQEATAAADKASAEFALSFSDVAAKIPFVDDIFVDYIRFLETMAQRENELAKRREDIAKIPSPLMFSGRSGALNLQTPSASDLPDQMKLSMVLTDVTRAADRLTDAQKRAALAAFSHGQNVETTIKTLEAYWPEIDKTRVSLDVLFKSYTDGVEKQKRFTEASANISALMAGPEGLSGAVEEAVKYFLELGATQGDLATYFGVSKGAIKAVADEQSVWAEIHAKTVTAALEHNKKFREDSIATAAVVNKALVDQISTQADFRRKLEELGSGTNPDIGLLHEWTDALNRLGPPMEGFEAQWQRTVDDIDAYFTAKLAQGHMTAAMKRAADEATHGFLAVFENRIATIPNILQQAFTGGGGFGGAAKAITSGFGADLGHELASSKVGQGLADGLAGAFKVTSAKGAGAIASLVSGGLSAGLAGLASAGIGLIGKLFQNPEKEINPLREAFVQAHGGLTALNKEAHDAGLTLDHLLNARNAQQYEAAVNELTDAFAKHQQQVDTVRSTYDSMTDRLKGITTISAPLQAALDKAFNATNATDLNTALAGISGVLDTQAQKQAHINDLVSKYGLNWTDASNEFKQAKVNEVAQGLIDDFTDLKGVFDNLNPVMEGMKEPLNDFVKKAQEAGVEVPEALRPILQTAIDAGVLFDKNGDKVTNLSDLGLTFGTDMVTATKNVQDALTHLADVIEKILGPKLSDITQKTNDIAGAASKIPDNPFKDWSTPDLPGDSNFASTGGRVTAHGIQHFARGGVVLPFVPRGPDRVPIMAEPGELILNAAQQHAVGAALSASNVSLSTAALESKLDRLDRRITDTMRRQPELISIAVRDAVALAS